MIFFRQSLNNIATKIKHCCNVIENLDYYIPSVTAHLPLLSREQIKSIQMICLDDLTSNSQKIRTHACDILINLQYDFRQL